MKPLISAAFIFFAHGDAGELQLGATTLTADNLIGYSEDLATWSQSHTQDVLLYGCNVCRRRNR